MKIISRAPARSALARFHAHARACACARHLTQSLQIDSIKRSQIRRLMKSSHGNRREESSPDEIRHLIKFIRLIDRHLMNRHLIKESSR
jgi:hypothetical protein